LAGGAGILSIIEAMTPPDGLIECVPNFSTADPQAAAAIAQVIADVDGAVVLHSTSDPDHARSVITFAGRPAAVLEAAVRATGEAARHIDLRVHRGVHPRIGATDVIPFVPLAGSTMADCINAARSAGHAIYERYGIPVYFYERAARRAVCQNLAAIRKGGIPPDLGLALHPSAGATVVGARKFLIAYNINLHSPRLEAAKAIAAKVRESSGGLPCVKALGLYLASRNQAQVSMNLTDFEITSVDAAFTAVQHEADALGIDIAGSELIGLIPQAAVPRLDVRWESFSPERVVEYEIERRLVSQIAK
jgi:glutamate formiminotransferase/glutamate formiminotransferase/formiminotetrahydrofolate cyclodeaminase